METLSFVQLFSSFLYLFPIYQRVRKGWEIIWQVACLVGKEQRDGRLSLSIWVYFGGELYMTLYICGRFSVFVLGVIVWSILLLGVFVFACTTLLHAGCICVPHYCMLGVPKQRNGPVTSAPLTHSREYIWRQRHNSRPCEKLVFLLDRPLKF